MITCSHHLGWGQGQTPTRARVLQTRPTWESCLTTPVIALCPCLAPTKENCLRSIVTCGLASGSKRPHAWCLLPCSGVISAQMTSIPTLPAKSQSKEQVWKSNHLKKYLQKNLVKK